MTVRRAALAALLVASVVLLIIVIGWEPGSREPAGPSTGLKVVVIGVDGMDWFLTRGMLEEGKLPSMTTLLKRAVTGEMAALLPAVPEHGWTALARGRGLSEDEDARLSSPGGRLFGLKPALAELVVREGGTALSVGWPASWPVGDAEAVVVAPYRPEAPVHETGLPAAILKGDPLCCPDELAERITGIVTRSEDACEAEFRRLIFDDAADESGWREHLLAARWAFLSDLATADVAAALMADEEPDLAMVCFGGMDAIGHRFLAPAMPSFFADAPPEYARYEDIVGNYFVFIDSCIERLRRLADENTVFVICSTLRDTPVARHPDCLRRPHERSSGSSHPQGPRRRTASARDLDRRRGPHPDDTGAPRASDTDGHRRPRGAGGAAGGTAGCPPAPVLRIHPVRRCGPVPVGPRAGGRGGREEDERTPGRDGPVALGAERSPGGEHAGAHWKISNARGRQENSAASFFVSAGITSNTSPTMP